LNSAHGSFAARCSGEILYSPKLRRGMRELRAALEAIAERLAVRAAAG
jgi:hypothetical protein